MKKNFKIMFLLGIIGFLSFTIFISNIFDDLDYNSKNRLENSEFWDLTSTPIHINDLNPSINWSKTASDNDWCSGSGTWNDPYLIENVTVDGLFTGSCILIENSEIPFIIRNCTFINSGRGAVWPESGIQFNNASNGYIENNTISLNGFHGISILYGSKNNTIANNIINNNDAGGIYLGYSSNNNTFNENIFNYNWDGALSIYDCSFNNFTGNYFTQTSSDITREISITGYNHSFSGNNFIDCGIYIRDDKPLSELSSHLIDKTNLVNGKPIYYYAKKQFLTKENYSNAGQVILVDCEYCEISNLNISNGGRGISLYYSHNNTIFKNNVSNSFVEEILLYKSHQNNVSHNSINNLDSSRGIYLRYSNENNVTFNQIIDCNTAIQVGTSFSNTISDNYLDDNYRGMYIQNGQIVEMYNIITRNIISNNSEGIYVTSPYTTNNTIYLNDFINNGVHAENNGGSNNWDNGLIGNNWDDYIGNDTNDDGIGETPRIIPGTAGDQDNFPIWADEHNGSKIIIDDRSSKNWEWATQFTWCSGSGTTDDPYVIKDCIIDGKNSSDCILIKNSNASFIIKDCIVFNASASDLPPYYGGITLEDTSNGLLINNNCSNNNRYGIFLRKSIIGCTNITIQDCIINDNSLYGCIGINIDRSHNLYIKNNEFNDNYRGINLGNSHNNTIVDNNFNNMQQNNIRLSVSDFNIVKRNYIYGGLYGIFLNANNNTVSFNEVYSCLFGIYAGGGSYNHTIANNTVHYNSYGVYLEHAFCQNMLIYNNSFIGNGLHAYDNGGFNDWDNGVIGNYWDNYTGSDTNDDGIGEDPYTNIQGLAFSQDNFPIWDDGYNGSKIIIDDSASNNWDWAKTRTWCSGSGTFHDPYIIEDILIDGNNLTSCIEIRNSIVFFKIENCTVFNSSSGIGLDYAGIELTNVFNGQLVINNCSNNNGNGIRLSNSDNNTILGNTANKNNDFGIMLSVSHNNNLSGNICNENYGGGIYLGLSTFNNISGNSAFNNDQRGLYLSSLSNNNTILNNSFNYNNQDGMFISDSHNNTFIGNSADLNDRGIWVRKSNNNTILGNNVSYNDFIGLWLYRSNNTDVIRNTFIGNSWKNIYDDESVNNYFKWNYLDGIFSPFIIDDDGGGHFTWTEARNLFYWCTGSGTYSDPYIMNNLIIDGQNSSSCIEIRDSTVFFKMVSCTLSNSGSGFYNAGIKLRNVINGQLINNDCSNNNGVGIGLIQSQNITIDVNSVNNNDDFGIFLEVSHNNILTGNTLNGNSDGMYLGLSTNNTISDNSVFNNIQRGIYLSSSSNNNTIMNNSVAYNGNNGIDVSGGHGVKVIGNIVNNNGWNGVMAWESNNNTIAENSIKFNDFAGIYLYSSNLSVVFNNFIANNTEYGMYLLHFTNSSFIYNNSLSNNKVNAKDDGSNNQWDNGVIGNDWSDYNGKDANDNGIGDTPYIIVGTAGSQDNLPIWWDAPVFSIISPLMNEEFKNNAPSYEISIIEGVTDTMWYTLDTGSTNQTFLSLTGVINQALWYNVPSGIVILRFTVNDSRGYSSYQEINILKILSYTILSPFIIDDTGGGDYTWAEAVQEHWCRGSGSSIDPYIIEFIKIDGQNSGSCLTIRYSQVYFTLENSMFNNSGNINDNDAGVKLINTTNGRLHLVNSSFNNGHGIILEFCEYIDITNSTINNNTLNGILLIDCNYVNILDNTNTINSNSESGIYLLRSHNNEISDNTIRYNSVGINLDDSNDNLIDRNNLLGNEIAILDNGENNIIGDGNILPGGTGFQFPFETLLIILIVGIVAIGITGSVIIRKRIMSSREAVGKREISEQKKEKVRKKLEKKLNFVDFLIEENKFKLAYKNLGKIKDTSDQYDFFDIFNKANKKAQYCMDVEKGIIPKKVKKKVTIPPKIEKEAKKVKKTVTREEKQVLEAKAIAPIIVKEQDFTFNLFISYSTIDRDHFQIENIVKELKKYPYINQISYWERDSKANIVEFMEETLEVSNIFVLFCSENTIKSKAVKDEWQAAFQMRKEDLIKIIPVYEEQKHIPKILWHLLNVKYDETDFNGFIENLYNEIKRE